MFPPDPFLSCTTHTDSSSDELSSQKGVRRVQQSSQKRSSAVTASGETMLSVPLASVPFSSVCRVVVLQGFIPALPPLYGGHSTGGPFIHPFSGFRCMDYLLGVGQ